MNRKIILLFCVAVVNLVAVRTEISQSGSAGAPLIVEQNNQIQTTLEFLKEGENRLKFDDNYRDVILLVGNTGAGKSTLTQYVAGDLADLESIGEINFVIASRRKGLISNSTTVSQTIYPGLVIDETKTAFYDCPGYDDTRSMHIEVASTYFVKKVVDHSDSLKLILVVDYNSVRKGGSRTDFPKLVRHFRNFAKNVTAYSNSIALIASKVPNEYVKVNKVPMLKSDEQVIGVIVEFLEEYRNQVDGEETSELNTYVIELIDILLRKNDDGRTYKKIGLFRIPDEAGPLNHIDSMVEQRGKLRDLILNRTTYGKKVDEYFGYTISETSRLKLIDLTQVVNQEITAAVRNISKEIEENFRDDERKLGSLTALTNRFQSGHTFLADIVGSSENMNGSLLVTQLANATNALHMANSHEFLDKILDFECYINFLQAFTMDRLPINPTEWMTGLKGCVDYLDQSKNWFKFLSEIYYQYSQYDFQCDRTKYNVFDVNDWGTAGRPQGIHINSDNFKTFVKKQNAALIENQKPTESQLDMLNNLLAITIKWAPVVSCEADDTKMVVKGDYVRTSEINIKQCGDKLKRLHIFALHTVFIDSDIDAVGLRLNLSIVAPKWYIFGDRKINLNGANNPFTYTTRAADSFSDRKAEAGCPGRPGGKAGNFVGLGLNIVNGDKLQIFGVGGRGSPGQDGGNGFWADDPKQIDTSFFGQKWKGVKSKQKSACPHSSGFSFCKQYIISGHCGSSGGDGGKGGKGGHHGDLWVNEIGSRRSNVRLFWGAGQTGAPGMSGRIGRNPNKIIRIRRVFGDEISRVRDDACSSIHAASNGANDYRIEEPETPSGKSFISVNEFKAFLRENQKNILKRDDLAQFIDQMRRVRMPLNNE